MKEFLESVSWNMKDMFFPLQKTEYDLKQFANFTSCSVAKNNPPRKFNQNPSVFMVLTY